MPIASPRRPAFDGLRGLAALVVVIHHAVLVSPALADQHRGGPMPSAGSWRWWATYTPLHLFWAGGEAVLVFFVLSGLVLALPAASGRAAGWRSYYPQRLLRLYIPIVAAAGMAYLLVAAVPRHPRTGSSWWLASHVSPVGLGETVRVAMVVRGTTWLNSAFWSLRWEVYFSVLLPVFLLALLRVRRWTLVRVMVLFALIAYGTKSGNEKLLYLPMFGLGVVMAQQLPRLDTVGDRYGRLRPTARRGIGLGVVLLVLARWWMAVLNGGNRASTLGTVLTVAGACLCVGLVGCTAAGERICNRRWIAWLGSRSFSLYLVHEPIVVTVAYLLHSTTDPALELAIALPVSLLAAEAFARLCEQPAHRFAQAVGRRLRPRLVTGDRRLSSS